MRIERIEGNNTFRVTVSSEDLWQMNVNVRNLTPGSPELPGFLFKVMERLKIETGLNTSIGQVIVQAMPDEQGVVLTVTRMAEEGKKSSARPKPRVKAVKRTVFRFDNFENLCQLLCRLSDEELVRMKLYEYRESFYLTSPCAKALVVEYCDGVCREDSTALLLKEHARRIAVGESMVSMVEGIKKIK